MTALDDILDGLVAELELERELGARTVEIDRALLRGEPAAPVPRPVAAPVQSGASVGAPRGAVAAPVVAPVVVRRETRDVPRDVRRETRDVQYDFVFLHHRALNAAGTEMMAKIVAAMGRTGETAPVLVTPPRPPAKVYVALGARALELWFPGLKGAPGNWLTADDGAEVLVTYSPEFILRFRTVTPEVQQIKKAMWVAIKSVLKKV